MSARKAIQYIINIVLKFISCIMLGSARLQIIQCNGMSIGCFISLRHKTRAVFAKNLLSCSFPEVTHHLKPRKNNSSVPFLPKLKRNLADIFFTCPSDEKVLT